MKKVLAMLVAVFALSVTVGCSGSSSTAPAPKKEEKKEEKKS